MIQDVDVFINKLQKIDGFGDAGEYLTSIVKSKKVEADSPPSPAPAPAPTTTSTAATNGTDEAKTADAESEKKTSSEETPQE